MAGPRSLAVALCWLLVVAAVGPGVVGSAGAQEQPAVDNTVTRIQVHPSGNATWEVVVRTRLETDAEVEQYRAFQERFRNDTEQYLDTFRSRISSVVSDAQRVSGREMRATNFSASTTVQEVPRRWGVITYRFEWTNFAAHPNESALAVGDVFQGGYYLDADDIFAVEAPEGYALATASPTPDERGSRTARWFGPRDFDDERPQAVFRATDADETTKSAIRPNETTMATSVTSTTAEPTASSDGGPGLKFVGFLVAAFGLAIAAVWRRRRQSDDATSDDATSDDATSTDATSDATATDPVVSPSPETRPSVKTDAERVETTLREHGGRLKQAEMADRLDWSASKTSRVLSDLEDEGVVERVRIGRENVVDLSESNAE